jgi:MFS family permease
VAIREVSVNLFEIPSGAIADVTGRKLSMVFSFIVYIVSFLIFSLAQQFWFFALAMFFFALGDAFRSGTHKAIILNWLNLNGLGNRKTEYYGYTRSWSKLGSALSVVISVVILFLFHSYRMLFIFSIVPYLLGLLNFTFYPPEKERTGKLSFRLLAEVYTHFIDSLKTLKRGPELRNLIYESMSFEGGFKAIKDYIQPLIKNMVLLLPLGFISADPEYHEYLTIGGVYLILYFLSAYASRKASMFAAKHGGEERAARKIWLYDFLIFALLVPLLYFELYLWAIIIFIGLYLIQNYWRPILISRISGHSEEKQLATILSIESQAKAFGTMLFAPLIGFLVDLVRDTGNSGAFWPVAAAGLMLSLPFIFRRGQ